MTIKGQEYLYLSPDGVWQFQIYVPAYMRHMFGGKRLYRKALVQETFTRLDTSAITCW